MSILFRSFRASRCRNGLSVSGRFWFRQMEIVEEYIPHDICAYCTRDWIFRQHARNYSSLFLNRQGNKETTKFYIRIIIIFPFAKNVLYVPLHRVHSLLAFDFYFFFCFCSRMIRGHLSKM